ncbi:MAG: hypothetical protein AB7H77_11425, partial [Bdellovibrionales bacterium]
MTAFAVDNTSLPDSELSDASVRKIQQQLRSLRHTDLLRVELDFTLAAAETEGVNVEILSFLRSYAEEACNLTDAFESKIIDDQIRAATQRPDPNQIEEDFQAYLKQEQTFRDHVHEKVLELAPSTGATEEQDKFLLDLVTVYDKLKQKIDRNINHIVRENDFDDGRKRVAKLRKQYSSDMPQGRRDGVELEDGATGPGFLERLFWREKHHNGDRIRYGETLQDLMNFISDIGKVRFGETVTAHPTELTQSDATQAYIDEKNSLRSLITEKSVDKFRELVKNAVTLRRKIMSNGFSNIQLDESGNIKNFLPIDEVANVRMPYAERY